jgi:ubiquinone biosynthesis protein UbiJ
MNLTDTNLAELLNRLSPRDRRLLSDALGEGGQLTQDVRAILRWLRRRLKRRARSKRR